MKVVEVSNQTLYLLDRAIEVAPKLPDFIEDLITRLYLEVHDSFVENKEEEKAP